MDFQRLLWFLFNFCLAIPLAQYTVLGHLSDPLDNHDRGAPKIINGTEAKWEGTRHQVSIRLAASDWFFGAGHICGGSLISSRIVLTAGHCIWSAGAKRFRNASAYSVVMGNLNRYQRDGNTLIFSVTEISVHRNFNATSYEADVALLHLNASVPTNLKSIYAIPLNVARNLTADTVCQVSGWGRTEDGGFSPQLMVVDVAVVNRSQCATNYGEFIRDGMICAGYMEGGRDACVGDSGGPLACDGRLVGVVSFGVGCAQPGYPGVYADVASYAEWISNKTKLLEDLDGHGDAGGFSDAELGDDSNAVSNSIGSVGNVGNNAAVAGRCILNWLFAIWFLFAWA